MLVASMTMGLLSGLLAALAAYGMGAPAWAILLTHMATASVGLVLSAVVLDRAQRPRQRPHSADGIGALPDPG